MKSNKEREREWDQQYGGLSDEALNEKVGASISDKLGAYHRAKDEAMLAKGAKYNLPYGEYAKRIKACEKRIAELPNILEVMIQAEQKRLEKQYDDAKENGLVYNSNREEWIAGELYKYMVLNEEYRNAKEELRTMENDLDIYTAKKKQWEDEHRDIINAEILRTQRAELLSADAETLAELGIKKPKNEVFSQAPSIVDNDLAEKLKALRAIHSYASEDEILKMAKTV